MGNTFKIERATFPEDTTVAGYGVVHAGTYRVEMPSDYDPEQVTPAAVIADGSMRFLTEWEVTWPEFAEEIREMERDMAPGGDTSLLGDLLEDGRKITGWTILQQWEEEGEKMLAPADYVEHWREAYGEAARVRPIILSIGAPLYDGATDYVTDGTRYGIRYDTGEVDWLGTSIPHAFGDDVEEVTQ
jgi:hypothetical protein